MPVAPQPIEGVSTAVTAFLGPTPQGPAESTTPIRSVGEYTRQFGPVQAQCPLSLSVDQFFTNGGTDAVIVRTGGEVAARLSLLDSVEDINLLVIPSPSSGADVPAETWQAAAAYAIKRRALLLVDSPIAWTVEDAAAGVGSLIPRTSYAALYFPHVHLADPAQPGSTLVVPPSGAVAGMMARTDRNRGVWKAPAGTDAVMLGTQGLSLRLTDDQQESLNPLGVNVLREFPGGRRVVWGARTLLGADVMNSQLKYVSVRRLFNYIELSIERGTRWVVSEPNEEATWEQVRQQVTDFLLTLWREGAFMGRSMQEAFFVRCDATTMTQEDIDNGRLIVHIGVAPVKPAEFVIVRIQQLLAQA